MVTLEVADLTEQELWQELRRLRRRVEKLAALLRLALALLHTSGFTLSGERLPDGHAKLRILRAVDRAHACIPLRAILRFLRVSPSRGGDDARGADVGFRLGADGRPRVRSMIGRPVRTRRPID